MSYDPYFKKNGKGDMPEYKTREKVGDILNYPYADLTGRGISAETTKFFNVRMGLDEADGTTPVAIYYPFHTKDETLSGWKKVDLTVAKNDKYRFTTIGKVGVECLLFGQKECSRYKNAHKKVIICESESDMLSIFEASVQSVRGTKFQGLKPFVVSVSCGCVNAADSIAHNMDFINGFEDVILAFDNDRATEKERAKGVMRGEEAAEEVAALLRRDKIFQAAWPSDYKDANEMLAAGKSGDLVTVVLFKYKHYSINKVVTAGDISFEDFIAPRVEGVYVKTLPKLMKKIHGLRQKELTLVTSPSGVGKSTITSEMAYSLSESGYRVGMIFLEEEVKETLQRMTARYLKKNYNSFKFDPTGKATMEELQQAYDWAKDNNRFIFMDHFGSIPLDQLMNKIKGFVYLHKVDYIILDHLSMIISGLDTDNERKMLDMVMTELAAFVATTDVGIIAVSHLNRKIVEDFRPPRGQEDQPHWVPVKKETMRGSASLEQLSWIVIGIEPELMPDRQRGRVRLVVLKNRPWSYLGVADVLTLDEETGLLVDASDAYSGQ